MRLFRRRLDESPAALVGREIRSAVSQAVRQHGVVNAREIVRALDRDDMAWYSIRARNYGESGSHYGIAELAADAAARWPRWPSLIGTPDLRKVWLGASELLKERMPLGGHMMDEENRRRAYLEFAQHLLFKLYEQEEAGRM